MLVLSPDYYIAIKLATLYCKLVKKLITCNVDISYEYKCTPIEFEIYITTTLRIYLIPSFITSKCLQKHEPNLVPFNNHIRISVTES